MVETSWSLAVALFLGVPNRGPSTSAAPSSAAMLLYAWLATSSKTVQRSGARADSLQPASVPWKAPKRESTSSLAGAGRTSSSPSSPRSPLPPNAARRMRTTCSWGKALGSRSSSSIARGGLHPNLSCRRPPSSPRPILDLASKI
eukprot:CAMPEP_0197513160 /NCGR_PEP_ID=MMETSP1312-20131121/79933_1 /TAXON_ID=464262 /ORGANISM="Genus nov. species nov., Strain RCC2335" /LENGTH=144 /DNA_ID=CAMNT_0043061287 /DNA_START=404 /DNA_END=838 /DNA_ORIENTATION=-